ncbi:MAG TPA: alkyl sulfatase dimerization domain-containing protein, partial [Myxococcota bacterium]|nr:alkyl sulfatase dimerization domain-containing protein [Myxococcota bacterium]
MHPRLAARLAASILLVSLGAGCGREPAPGAGDADSGHADPTPRTAQANAAVLDALPFEDDADFAAARRGFVAAREDPVIRDAQGREVWNVDDFDFVEGDAPASVNPSLWRQAKLNGMHGLYEVTPGIWQVRGYDLANMTFVAGDLGWIVIDPGTTIETGRAALDLANEQLGERPVTGLVYTHSHIDHFGGARGVLPDPGDTPVIAPEGFVVEAVSENVLAGTTMSRRASYMFGFLLHRGARGHVDSGLGKASTPGTFSLVAPTRFVDHTPTEITVDGVRMVFQNTPGAEAPAEMMIWLPEKHALCGAENVSHVLHNLYTLRGAKVRDALRWSNYIQDTIDRFGGEVEVLFASHHWPTWGNAEIVEYLKRQRDAYKYLHDQTLRLANHGETMIEIAEQLELPERLARDFALRGYYGTVNHDAKAVYQHYFGFFDGVPAHLNPLPPAEAAVHYVEFMGGGEALLAKARASYERGEYRWVAEVVNHLVFAEPENAEAKALLADAYDQLGYQAESGPWRDFYLTGAKELREGRVPLPFETTGSSDIVAAMPSDLFFDALAVRLNGPKAEGEAMTLNFVFTDVGETHVVWVENAVLHHR